MIEKIKESLVFKNRELKAKVNTLELENELLKDKRIAELLKALNGESKCEEKDKQIRHLEAKMESLKEVIKELKKK